MSFKFCHEKLPWSNLRCLGKKMEKYSQVTEIYNKDTLLHYRPHKKWNHLHLDQKQHWNYTNDNDPVTYSNAWRADLIQSSNIINVYTKIINDIIVKWINNNNYCNWITNSHSGKTFYCSCKYLQPLNTHHPANTWPLFCATVTSKPIVH